jgi:hypothetical protein
MCKRIFGFGKSNPKSWIWQWTRRVGSDTMWGMKKRMTVSLFLVLAFAASAEAVCHCGVVPERENDFF